MKKEKTRLENFKEKYEIIRRKYNLPKFSDINKEFEIEKICRKETEFLIRNIRREIIERITHYLRFLEALINPSNAPLLFFALANKLTEKEKKILNDLYSTLSSYLVKSIYLDNINEEEEDVKLIMEIYKNWTNIKNKFNDIIKVLDEDYRNKKENKFKGYIY
ncbi:MAG: hypothetical protein QW117_00040 [Candidatus Pacearchaeota archaeon]